MFPNCPPDICGGGFIDSNCEIYHLFNQSPTNLINLGLPNGSSAQLIFETIDHYLGSLAQNIGPITPISTNAINFSGSGVGGRILTPTLILASGSTQIASILPTGLFVPDLRDWKVKVNANDFPDYLVNKVIGGIDPFGIVSITTELDPSGLNLVAVLPNINLIALANNAIFDNALANNETFLGDLTNNSFFKNALVSPNAGNIIVALSNGLYASGSTSLTSANNGLSTSGNIVQLGGPLIKNTGISFASTYLLSFTSRPRIYLGDGSIASNTIFQIDNTYQPNGFTIGALSTTTGPLGANGLIGVNGNIVVQTGTDTDHSVKAGVYGQAFFNNGGTATLASFPEVVYSGTVGLLTTYGSTTVSGNAVIAGNAGITFGADTATITNLAALLSKGLYQAPQGAAYSGTITNYYGLYIEDVATAGLASHITNKYAIFQAGNSALNVFATTPTITSDFRLKENITTYTKGLAEISKLRTVNFNYIGNPKDDIRIGVIAQEIEKVIPEAIKTLPIGELEDCKLVQNDTLFLVMLNAIKDLKSLNDALAIRIGILESK